MGINELFFVEACFTLPKPLELILFKLKLYLDKCLELQQFMTEAPSLCLIRKIISNVRGRAGWGSNHWTADPLLLLVYSGLNRQHDEMLATNKFKIEWFHFKCVSEYDAHLNVRLEQYEIRMLFLFVYIFPFQLYLRYCNYFQNSVDRN